MLDIKLKDSSSVQCIILCVCILGLYMGRSHLPELGERIKMKTFILEHSLSFKVYGCLLILRFVRKGLRCIYLFIYLAKATKETQGSKNATIILQSRQ